MCCLAKKHAENMETITYLLHLGQISGCLPVLDELCRRSISFVRSCLSHESYLIRFVANYIYAVVHARSH